MNSRYVVLRLLRRFTPEAAARFLLKRRWIIRPGLESTDPAAAAKHYVEALSRRGMSLAGKRVLVFGYGGRLAIGVELIKKGAGHVVLCDHFVLPDRKRDLELLPDYDAYLQMENGEVKPRAGCMSLLHGDIRDARIQQQVSRVDYVVSTSVYEHLQDVGGISRALANLTAPQGAHLHFVDLRDHYFKYPFEMLSYSNLIWKSFLNPTSNLNRLRLPDYKRIFEGCFQRVEIKVLERLENELQAARTRIRLEFRTGDPAVDSAALILVVARGPLTQESGACRETVRGLGDPGYLRTIL